MNSNIISKYFIFPIKSWLKRRRLSFIEFFEIFQKILETNNNILDLMTDMTDKLDNKATDIDLDYIYISCFRISDLVYHLIEDLNRIAPYKYYDLYDVFEKIYSKIKDELDENIVIPESDYIVFYSEINMDFIDIVGAKNANLAEIKKSLKIDIPHGFAITTRAFKEYLDYNQIWEKIRDICKKWEEEWFSTSDASSKIQQLILNGELPPPLIKKIKKGIKKLKSLLNTNELFFAVRSSAWGEDSEQHTFAGQYLSLLNIPSDNIFNAYKDVIASVYSARAMEYRRLKGYREHEVAMAVACQVLVDADVSGIMYTVDPQNPENNNMAISSTWGLGAPLASGYASADQFIVSRQPPHPIKEMTIVYKEGKLIPKKGGGTEICPIFDKYRHVASLNNEQLMELVKIGIKIENYFRKPQDIEFTYDKKGKLYILQTRPLIIDLNTNNISSNNIVPLAKGAKIIMSGKGYIAQRGIAFGKVFIIKDERDMEYFPKGAVLVAENALPDFAKIIKMASAVITDIGSPVGHMATIVREFRVPSIVNTGVATKILKNGQEITVDAERNIIYDGKIEGLAFYSLKEEPIGSKYENRLLRRVLKNIVPLNLVNPMDRMFSPKYCKTFHDITRFIHEKAVEEIINISLYVQNSKYPARRLDLSIPIDLVIVDIGGGINTDVKGDKIKPNHIKSVPMKAFIDGITTPGIWSTEPVPVDFGSFMSSLTRTFAAPLATPEYVGQNLAVLSENYVNINLRLGYHFNLVDSYISDNVNANYIYFRFVGGATDISRRSRRARLIGEILEKQGFTTELRGDLVVARTGRFDTDEMKYKLKIVGMLVGFTRQLDVKMVSDHQVNKFINIFNSMVEEIYK